MTTPPTRARTNRAVNEVIASDDINVLAVVANGAADAAAAAAAVAAEARALAGSGSGQVGENVLTADNFTPQTRSLLLGVSEKLQTGSYTLQPDDWQYLQVFTSPTPVTLTVPANLLPGKVYSFVQWGAGRVTVVSAQTGGEVSVRASRPYASNAFATAHGIVMPTAGASDGLLVALALASSSVAITPPADFTLARRIGPAGAHQALFTKHNAPASDSGATKNFQLSGTGTPVVAVAVSLRGAHISNMLDSVTPASGDVESDAVGDEVTTTTNGVLELAVRSGSSGTAAVPLPTAPPTGGGLPMTLLNAAATLTGSSTANSMVAVAAATGVVPAGTTIGNRAWPSQYGATSTLGIAPNLTDAGTIVGSRRTTAEPGSFGDVVVLSTGVVVTGDLVSV